MRAIVFAVLLGCRSFAPYSISGVPQVSSPAIAACKEAHRPAACLALADQLSAAHRLADAWLAARFTCEVAPASAECVTGWGRYHGGAPTTTESIGLLVYACRSNSIACDALADWHASQGHEGAATHYAALGNHPRGEAVDGLTPDVVELDISSPRAGASVYIDGTLISDQLPLSVEVEAGTHLVGVGMTVRGVRERLLRLDGGKRYRLSLEPGHVVPEVTFDEDDRSCSNWPDLTPCAERANRAAAEGRGAVAWAYTDRLCGELAPQLCVATWENNFRYATSQTEALVTLDLACKTLSTACQRMARWHAAYHHVAARRAYLDRVESANESYAESVRELRAEDAERQRYRSELDEQSREAVLDALQGAANNIHGVVVQQDANREAVRRAHERVAARPIVQVVTPRPPTARVPSPSPTPRPSVPEPVTPSTGGESSGPQLCEVATIQDGGSVPISSCVQIVWRDPDNYQWISLKNLCEQPLKVTFAIAFGSAPTSVGSIDLQSQRKVTTGYGKTEQGGVTGVTTAPCPIGCIPMTGPDQYWGASGGTYTCRKI